jgi:hypothetical protein
MPPEVIQLITVLGAAGVAIWIILLLTGKEPKLHTHSEVDGLRQDKAALFEANRGMQQAQEATNTTLADILEILREDAVNKGLAEILRLQNENLSLLRQIAAQARLDLGDK